ncbi:MAG: class I SAM-dependent methyltransferase [Candidatus Zixiibacteriota bacterium]|nr:MAG: class I SAM-dependent methyltransferase [candidate division Zixibacteria bacterium]
MKNVYGDFSRYYDMLGWNLFAGICAERLKEFFKLRGEKPETALNLACGTGELEKLLRKTGIEFTGVDASPGMLREARKKCPEARFVKADAADVRLNRKFDMVLFLFDSANHMYSLPHLSRVFKNSRRHLKKGGYFIFDINTPIGLKAWEETQVRRARNFTVITMGIYNEEEMMAEVIIEAFIKEGRSYRRMVQLLTEKTYETQDIIEALVKAKLDKIVITSFDPSEEIEDAGRLWFVCS